LPTAISDRVVDRGRGDEAADLESDGR